MGLRDKIRHRERKTVTVLGEDVEVRQLAPLARCDFEDSLERDEEGNFVSADLMVKLVIATAFNPDGTPVFTADDLPWLKAEANGTALADLFVTAKRLNGYLRDVSEKNSPTAPPSASPTA